MAASVGSVLRGTAASSLPVIVVAWAMRDHHDEHGDEDGDGGNDDCDENNDDDDDDDEAGRSKWLPVRFRDL